MIFRNADGNWRYIAAPSTPVSSNYFKPNDMLVIVSRNGGTNNSWTWTYHPSNFYVLPTRWMGQ